jgi:hypothetical protein
MTDTQHIHIRDSFYLRVGSLMASPTIITEVNNYIDAQQNRIRGYETHRCVLAGFVVFTVMLFFAIIIAKAIIGGDVLLEEANSWLTSVMIVDGIVTVFLGIAISSTLQFQDTDKFFTLHNMYINDRPATIIYLRDVNFEV